MGFLKNCWYLAGWGEELAPGAMLPRRIAGQPLLFLRSANGTASVMDDRCPHRLVPLSRGQFIDDQMVCAYHGLAFGTDGRCSHNPHGPIPAALAARAYPLVERHSALWVWLGNPEAADPATIPPYDFIDRQKPEARVTGHLVTRAHYMLMVDNILDLTHADYLHASSLGGGINTVAKREVVDQGAGMMIRWRAMGETLPPLMRSNLPDPNAPGDYLNEVCWLAPGNMHQRLAFAPVGGLETPAMFDSRTCHVMTPETATTTHYFFCHTSDGLTHNPALAAPIRAALMHAFQNEDGPMLEAQQEALGTTDLMDLHPVLLPIDSGAARARVKLAKLLENEKG